MKSRSTLNFEKEQLSHKRINNLNLITDIGYRKGESIKKKMIDRRRKGNGEFDFDKLPEGSYYFSGKEGFVKVDVDKNGNQSWNLENWFDSLDPDKSEEKHHKIIQDIKSRLNTDTGMINPTQKDSKINLFKLFKK